jgi:hypothetical protein
LVISGECLAGITMGQPGSPVYGPASLWTARRALAVAKLSANVRLGTFRSVLRSVTMMILLALCSAVVST